MARIKRKILTASEAAAQRAERLADERERERLSRADPQQWGVNEGALKHAGQERIRDEAPTRDKVRRLQRLDAIDQLEARKAISSEDAKAVRRLEEKIAERYRLDSLPSSAMGGGVPVPVSDRSLDARACLDYLALRTGGASWRLLAALMEPAVVDGQMSDNWRAVVERVGNEVLPHGQTAIVRHACQNLREAWTLFDGEAKRPKHENRVRAVSDVAA